MKHENEKNEKPREKMNMQLLICIYQWRYISIANGISVIITHSYTDQKADIIIQNKVS